MSRSVFLSGFVSVFLWGPGEWEIVLESRFSGMTRVR